MENIVKTFMQLPEKARTEYYMNYVYDRYLAQDFHITLKKMLKLQDHLDKRFFYLITFTYESKFICVVFEPIFRNVIFTSYCSVPMSNACLYDFLNEVTFFYL